VVSVPFSERATQLDDPGLDDEEGVRVGALVEDDGVAGKAALDEDRGDPAGLRIRKVRRSTFAVWKGRGTRTPSPDDRSAFDVSGFILTVLAGKYKKTARPKRRGSDFGRRRSGFRQPRAASPSRGAQPSREAATRPR